MQVTSHIHDQILYLLIGFVVKTSVGRSKQTSFLQHFSIYWLRERVVLMEKFLENLVRIFSESIASFQFSVSKKTLF